MKKRFNKHIHFRTNRFDDIIDYIHEHIIVIIIAVVILAGAVSTVFIIKDNSTSTPNQEEQVTYKEMSTIYLPMSKVASLNPLTSEDSDTYNISQLVFSSLFKLDENMSPVKDLVDKYTARPSKGNVTIHLHDNVKFSDGAKLTAEDVRFTIGEIKRIGSSCPYYEYASKIDSVSVEGTYKLTITFENRKDAALDNLVFPIVSRSSYSSSASRIPGSGQYAFGAYDPMKSLKLKPNPEYFGTKPQNKIQFKIIEKKDNAAGLMTMDYITAFVNTKSDADVEGEDKNLKVKQISSGELEYMGFNFRKNVIKNKIVRQAIAKAIDTQTLINDNYGSAAVTSDSVYFPGFLGTENKGDAYEQDIKGAAELMEKAGFKDYDEDGILEDKKDKELSMTILVNENNGSRSDTAYSIAEILSQIGIKASVRALPWDEYRAAIKAGKFDLYLGGYKFDKKFNLREMFRRGNYLRYSNEKVLSLVNKMETCQSIPNQKKTYEELKAILTEELPYYALCYKTYGFMTVQRFTAEEYPTFFDPYRGVATWKWEKIVVTPAKEDEKVEEKEKKQ